MLGKYSPTVSKAYSKDQNWFNKYSNGQMYDPEGFDSYGYNEKDIDRAGNSEIEYSYGEHGERLYENVIDTYTFDGTKPVKDDEEYLSTPNKTLKEYLNKFIPTNVITISKYAVKEEIDKLNNLNYKTFNNWEEIEKSILQSYDVLTTSDFLSSLNFRNFDTDLITVQICVLSEIKK